jgi:hypothetical protein
MSTKTLRREKRQEVALKAFLEDVKLALESVNSRNMEHKPNSKVIVKVPRSVKDVMLIDIAKKISDRGFEVDMSSSSGIKILRIS